jgi:hypothetical protein
MISAVPAYAGAEYSPFVWADDLAVRVNNAVLGSLSFGMTYAQTLSEEGTGTCGHCQSFGRAIVDFVGGAALTSLCITSGVFTMVSERLGVSRQAACCWSFCRPMWLRMLSK